MRTRNPNAPAECLPPAVIVAAGALLIALVLRNRHRLTRAHLYWVALAGVTIVLALLIGAPGGAL